MDFIKLLNKIVNKYTKFQKEGGVPKKIMLGGDEMDVFINSLGDVTLEWDKNNMLKKVELLGCKVGVRYKDGVEIL